MEPSPRRAAPLAVAFFAAAVLLPMACDPGTSDPPDFLEEYAVSLHHENIVGTDVVSEATGTATLTWDSVALDYTIDVFDMDDVIAAHIHGPGTQDQNANIILTLFAPDQPTTVEGRLVAGRVGPGSALLSAGITLDSVLHLMRTDNSYVMVHSSEYPGGEIRGQIVRQP